MGWLAHSVPAVLVFFAGPHRNWRGARWAITICGRVDLGWVHGRETFVDASARERITFDFFDAHEHLGRHHGNTAAADREVIATRNDAFVAQLIVRSGEIVGARGNRLHAEFGNFAIAGRIYLGLMRREARRGDASDAVVVDKVERAGRRGSADATIRFANFKGVIWAKLAGVALAVLAAHNHAFRLQAVLAFSDGQRIKARRGPVDCTDITFGGPRAVGAFGALEIYP